MLVLANACGGGGGGALPPPPPKMPSPSVIGQPTQINVYPADATATSNARIYVIGTQLGAQPVRLRLAVDTGSAGLTVDALQVFPSSLVSASGFQFGSGQHSLSFQGITVTDQAATRTYGGTNGHTQVGNLGYAQITFGDSAGTLTTATLPILFYYKVLSSTDQLPVAETGQDGWFGINDAPNLIKSTTGGVPYPVCADGVSGSCWTVSVFKYLSFASGVDAGFLIGPVTLAACDIAQSGSCTPQPALTIGVTAALATGYSISPLTCPPAGYTGPAVIAGDPVCQERIPGATVVTSAAPGGTYASTVLFDSGTPFSALNVPAGTSFPGAIPAGDTVSFTTPSGYTYTQTSGNGVSSINVQLNAAGSDAVVGLAYFTDHALLVDFASGTQGNKP